MKIFVVFLAILGLCCGDTKTWQQNVNFGNADNWDSGQVPCASDTIIFPDTISVVFMQTNSTLKEIRLPMNGALVLDNNIKLAFSDDSNVDPNCDGQEQTFTREVSENWFDPGNWVGAGGPVAVDTENIPCQFDRVVFPTNNLFYVGVDLSTTVGTINFLGQEYTSTSSFSSFLSSTSGQQQFSLTSNPTIQLQNRQCGDLTGCTCGNDVEPVRSTICGIRTDNCPPLTCSNPPTPVGGCCPVCGAIISMDYNSQAFNFEDVKSQIEDNFGLGPASNTAKRRKRATDSGVTMYMSKTSENKIQMVFTDDSTGSSSGQAAVQMAQDVENEIMANQESYGVSGVSMQNSNKGTGGRTGEGLSGGGIAGVIIAVIIVVTLVSTVLFWYIRRNSFNFKDEPLHDDVEMSSSLPPGFMQEIPNPAYDSGIRGFDNPIYNTPQTKENLYEDPTQVKVPGGPDEKAVYVEEKGAINGHGWEDSQA